MQKKTQFLQKKECCAGALEGRLIATLCRLSGAKSVLEVGMFTGTTTLAVAEAIPSDGKVMMPDLFTRGLSQHRSFAWDISRLSDGTKRESCGIVKDICLHE